jgi:hypothetical protein
MTATAHAGMIDGRKSPGLFPIPNPGSRVVQEIVRDVFIHAVPAKVHKQHGFDLSKDHQAWHVFPAYETPIRGVFFVKLVKFIVIVLHHSLCNFFIDKSSCPVEHHEA